jgi:hypothetical protein
MLGRLTNWAREGYQEHQDFCLLALLFTSFRFLTLLLFEPGGYILDWSGYYVPGANFVQLSDWGYYPVVHYWMEYPPLFPWLAVVLYRLSLLLPAWRDPNLWFNLLLGSALLLFEIGNFVLVYAIASKLKGRQTAVRCCWLYGALFFPLMTLLFWFENLPLFFLLLGVYLILTRRPIWGGVVAGIGFMIKFIPALVAPVAVRAFPKMSQKVLYALAAALVVLLIALPFLLTNPTFFLVPFLHLGSIGSWETVWALLDGNLTGGETTPLESRFDLATVTATYHETWFPYPLVALAFVVVFLILYTRRIDWQDNLVVVAFSGLTITLFLLFSKGYSPQWIINVLPFIILLMPNLRGVAYALLLMGVNVAEFPVALILLNQHPWLFVIAVVLRTVLLVLVGIEFGLLLFEAPRLKRALGLALTSVVLAVVVGALPVAALAVRDYSVERLQENAYRETIDYLSGQPAGGVIFTDPLLYRQVYSFLVRTHGLYLLEANQSLPQALAALEGRHSSLYVVYAGSEDDQLSNPAVESWLGEQAFPVGVEWLNNARVTRYSTPTSALEEQPLEATFAEQMALTSCAFEPSPSAPADVLHVSLSWRSLGSTEGDYTVFVHLIDGSERVWAQHDGGPAGGSRLTSSWQPGEEITDHHGLALPADLPPGEYSLAVGLYDAATGERLPVDTSEGTAPSDRVLVGPVLIAPATD